MIDTNQPDELQIHFAFMMHAEDQESNMSNINVYNGVACFLLHSGASDHASNDKKMFSEFVDLQPPERIYIAKNGAYIEATKRGQIQVTSDLGFEGCLKDVLFCPELLYNLLSVLKKSKIKISLLVHCLSFIQTFVVQSVLPHMMAKITLLSSLTNSPIIVLHIRLNIN